MSTPYDADISDQSSVILNLKFPTFQDAPNNQLMLLLFTHKSRTGPPLRYVADVRLQRYDDFLN